MIKKEWDNILASQEIRKSLSKIRQAIKVDGQWKQFKKIIKGNEEILIALLKSEDAKTRKNAALLMGDLGEQEFLPPIWEAYQNESQRFIKNSYLVAVGQFNYDIYKADIRRQLDILKAAVLTPENEKHVMAEMRELSALLIMTEGIIAHTFTGWDNSYDIVLIANRNFTALLGKELQNLEPTAQVKEVGAGIMAHVANLRWLRELRIYQEILFMIPGMKVSAMEATEVAQTIVDSKLLFFLENAHDGGQPYHFRLEMKSRKSLGEKSDFLKKVAGYIEKLSQRKLINSTTKYEIEIRLIENKQGYCNIMVKLFTLQDKRFTYREEFIPISIKPVNAALTVALAKEFMVVDAQVLDPFCGVGTMLIERHKAIRAKTTYGIDIQEESIVKARHNTEVAHQMIHYINRDFFSFTHDYLFDEVITNMPFKIGRTGAEEIYEIYEQFFHKVPKHLKSGAIVVLYSHDRELVRQMMVAANFKLLKEYEISKREETYVFILQY